MKHRPGCSSQSSGFFFGCRESERFSPLDIHATAFNNAILIQKRNTTMLLENYPEGTRIRIGPREFQKTTTSSFWKEVHQIPGNCVRRPSASLKCIEETTGRSHVVIGYFVDWDGNTRCVEAPGDGYRCQVVVQRTGSVSVDLNDTDGSVCHEADYHPTLAALRSRGVEPRFVEEGRA